jgi:hypothetical protein
MKQNLPLPVIIAVVAAVLVAVAVFLVRRSANRENDGIDMATTERIQKQMHQQRSQSGSPVTTQKAYYGGR